MRFTVTVVQVKYVLNYHPLISTRHKGLHVLCMYSSISVITRTIGIHPPPPKHTHSFSLYGFTFKVHQWAIIKPAITISHNRPISDGVFYNSYTRFIWLIKTSHASPTFASWAVNLFVGVDQTHLGLCSSSRTPLNTIWYTPSCTGQCKVSKHSGTSFHWSDFLFEIYKHINVPTVTILWSFWMWFWQVKLRPATDLR